MKSNRTCYILIADGFAEKSVSQAVQIFRNYNIKPIFLNLFASPLLNRLFAKYRVDSVLIGDITDAALPNGLLFAGGEDCAQLFLIDPRVHQLVCHMKEINRPVGYLYPAATSLVDKLSPKNCGKRLLLQERLHVDQFLHDFMQHMSSPNSLFKQQAASLLL